MSSLEVSLERVIAKGFIFSFFSKRGHCFGLFPRIPLLLFYLLFCCSVDQKNKLSKCI